MISNINVVLFDTKQVWKDLLPFTFTRPSSEIRVGILTIAEKYKKFYGATVSYLVEDYLTSKFPSNILEENILIAGNIYPSDEIWNLIQGLAIGEVLKSGNTIIAAKLNKNQTESFFTEYASWLSTAKEIERSSAILHPWCIFRDNESNIAFDFKKLTHNRKSLPLPNHVIAAEPDRIFVEEGAILDSCVLNAAGGYIYIGKDSHVMDGAVVRGSLALCEHSQLKLSAKIYGPTTIGLHSKVGGEINNSVIFGYSNKAHDGFLGNSVIGEWCNLGADTNNSNLKNNYENVKLWSYNTEGFENTGLQFCGLFMGDHSKCGINTMFNTGTVVGVSANIFGAGFPRNFIPSFSWGGSSGFSTYKIEKAFQTADLVMQRRGMNLNNIEQDILKFVFSYSEKYRNQ
jgi:UDP-N-acetylglucosamine diphosphorylase/glucosamine-1-phosphate N-acetyltransferase